MFNPVPKCKCCEGKTFAIQCKFDHLNTYIKRKTRSRRASPHAKSYISLPAIFEFKIQNARQRLSVCSTRETLRVLVHTRTVTTCFFMNEIFGFIGKRAFDWYVLSLDKGKKLKLLMCGFLTVGYFISCLFDVQC